MEKLYRKDYTGEFFIHKISYHDGSVTEEREWVPNAIAQFNHTGNAVIIGNGPTRLALNLVLIGNHRGGHLGKKKLMSYGCNALYRDFAPTFLVANNEQICREVVKSEYSKTHIVYANPAQILEHPSSFHLIPYDRYWNAGTTATWLACFDGMKKIYLLGFDNQPTKNVNSNVYASTAGYSEKSSLVDDSNWINDMYEIFKTYDDVEFVCVEPVSVPELWKYAPNLRQATLREFVVEADLGA